MGYPMTWKRLINRNGFAALNLIAWLPNVNTQSLNDDSPEVSKFRRERIERYSHQAVLLDDDLRRLERDGLDEKSIAEHIAKRASVDIELVAAVLKEFFSF